MNYDNPKNNRIPFGKSWDEVSSSSGADEFLKDMRAARVAEGKKPEGRIWYFYLLTTTIAGRSRRSLMT